MQKQDWSQFRELMRHTANLTDLYGKNVEDIAASMFAELGDYPLDEVANAVRRCYQTRGAFPTLRDILQQLEGGQAEEAWELVWLGVERWGYYQSVKFPDPAIHGAIAAMGGWPKLYKRLSWEPVEDVKSDFAAHYAEAVRGGTARKTPPYLAGWHEMDNRARGQTHSREVWDVATGQRVPESELPALEGGQSAALVRMVAGGMEVPA